jgi:hypothetical protein
MAMSLNARVGPFARWSSHVSVASGVSGATSADPKTSAEYAAAQASSIVSRAVSGAKRAITSAASSAYERFAQSLNSACETSGNASGT